MEYAAMVQLFRLIVSSGDDYFSGNPKKTA